MHDRASAVAMRLLLLAVIATACLLFPHPLPASAHATLASSSPASGTHLHGLPDRVVLRVIRKDATSQGDPIAVYAPDGRRVDRGQAVVGPDRRSISVSIGPAPTEYGVYQIVYRIVSADQHVIAGRLPFTVQHPGAAGEARTGGPRVTTRQTMTLPPHPLRPATGNGALGIALVMVAAILLGAHRGVEFVR